MMASTTDGYLVYSAFSLIIFLTGFLFALFCLYNRNIARRIITPVWRVLDPIYKISGVIAASFMVIILSLIVGQMVSRWTGTVFPGGTEFAGYAMACTSFFALAYTLNHGAHIRVSIFLNMNDFLLLIKIFHIFFLSYLKLYYYLCLYPLFFLISLMKNLYF